MKGHVTERSPGKWAIVLDIYDDNGKRRRKWHTFHTTSKRKAEEECARLIAEMRGGTYIEPSKLTVAAYLDTWLDHMRSQITPRTHERYSEIVNKNIVPAIGSANLTKLKPNRYPQPIARRSQTAAGTARVDWRRRRWFTCTGSSSRRWRRP